MAQGIGKRGVAQLIIFSVRFAGRAEVLEQDVGIGEVCAAVGGGEVVEEPNREQRREYRSAEQQSVAQTRFHRLHRVQKAISVRVKS